MQGLARLQLIGPLLLFAVIAAAEGVAFALTQAPASATLWYFNLEIFSIFRRSRWLLSEFCTVPYAQLFLAGPLALVALIGLVVQRNFLTALATNLSLIYVGLIAYSWHAWTIVAQVQSASLVAVHVPPGRHLLLLAGLALAAFISFAASHILYIRGMRAQV